MKEVLIVLVGSVVFVWVTKELRTPVVSDMDPVVDELEVLFTDREIEEWQPFGQP